jgi:hypothetical protein
MNGYQKYEFDHIRTLIENELHNENMPVTLYASMDGIARVINSIVETNGEGWIQKIVDDNGNSILNDNEKEQFKTVFQPHIESIVGFFSKKMSGGVIGKVQPALVVKKTSKATEPVVPVANVATVVAPEPVAPVVATPVLANVTKAPEAPGETPVVATEGATVAPGATPVVAPVATDEKVKSGNLQVAEVAPVEENSNIFEKIMGYIENIDKKVKTFTTDNFGILKLEKDYDEKEDIRPFSFLDDVKYPLPMFLVKIKIPFRFIVSSIYLILDISRIAISQSGNASGHKLMTVVVSLFEFLRGDWKKAIITMMAYYNENNLIIGELLKVFISIFRTIDPVKQKNIIFGSIDTMMSMVFGSILSIIQVTAFQSHRDSLRSLFETILQFKVDNDETLKQKGLPPLPEFYNITMDNINDIQSVINDPIFICTPDFIGKVETLTKLKNPLINILLRLLGISTTKGETSRRCTKIESAEAAVVDAVVDAKPEAVGQGNENKKANEGNESEEGETPL